MGSSETSSRDRWRDIATVRSRWRWTLAVGLVMVACGIGAIMLPVVADFAMGTVLGAALAIVGVAKIVQGVNLREWGGANWQIMLGAAEVVGGILIYLNPVKGALAIALLLAVVFLIEAVMQIALAFKMRPEAGWVWLLAAGLVALVASVGIVLTARRVQYFTPGTFAGIAILAGGWACVVIALVKQRVPPSG